MPGRGKGVKSKSVGDNVDFDAPAIENDTGNIPNGIIDFIDIIRSSQVFIPEVFNKGYGEVRSSSSKESLTIANM